MLKLLKQTIKGKDQINSFYEPEKLLYYVTHHPSLLEKFNLDSSDIPYFDYRKEIGIQYTPVITALFALNAWNTAGGISCYDSAEISRFFKLTNWFLKHEEKLGRYWGWYYKFNWWYRNYLILSPWLSAMGNGMAISCLVRAWLLTKNKCYLESCERALEVFEHGISDGGVKAIDDHGCVWFEEYPVLPSPHVLNGFVFALFGLYDFALIGNNNAERLFSEGINTLEKHLTNYDLGYWSAYDLLSSGQISWNSKDLCHFKFKISRCLAMGHYHALHVQQMRILYLLSRREYFQTMYLKWRSYYRLNRLCFLFLHLMIERAGLVYQKVLRWDSK